MDWKSILPPLAFTHWIWSMLFPKCQIVSYQGENWLQISSCQIFLHEDLSWWQLRWWQALSARDWKPPASHFQKTERKTVFCLPDYYMFRKQRPGLDGPNLWLLLGLHVYQLHNHALGQYRHSGFTVSPIFICIYWVLGWYCTSIFLMNVNSSVIEMLTEAERRYLDATCSSTSWVSVSLHVQEFPLWPKPQPHFSRYSPLWFNLSRALDRLVCLHALERFPRNCPVMC